MQDNETVHVSVVVPCRNEIRHIREFLDSVMRQDLGQIEMEVLIADGMSDDGTRPVLREFESRFAILQVLDNPGKIVSTGLNRAIRKAKGEIIIRMDAHTLYAPDYVRTCVRVLNETNADNVGGPALTRAEGYLAQAIALAYRSPFASGGAKFHDPKYQGLADTVTYGCWRKSTLDRIGLFDEELVCGQDGDLNLRLISSGGRIWQTPKITSWYWTRETIVGLFRQYFQYGFWKMCVIQKHRRPAAWRNLVPGGCLILGILLLLGAAGANLIGARRWESEFLRIELGFGLLYLATSLVTSILTARRSAWRFLPVLPVVFATYHISYALGFLLALVYRRVGDRISYMSKVLTTITR